jgi:hypothetical protein
MESNYKSSTNILDNNDVYMLENFAKKGISIKKKKNTSISLYKDNLDNK